MGFSRIGRHHQRAEQEGVRPHHGMAPETAAGQVSLRLPGRDLPEAQLGGDYENVAVLVAMAVNEDGYREIIGAAEGMKNELFTCLL